MIVADGITLQENNPGGGSGGAVVNPISVLPKPSTPARTAVSGGVSLGEGDTGYSPPPAILPFLNGGIQLVSSTFGAGQGPTGGTINPSSGGIAQTGTGIQNETDTAAQNPPYNPNTPPIQQAIPTTPDDTAAALNALGNVFSSAFASGQPAALTIGGGGGGASTTPTSTVDTSTTDPNAATDTTSTPSSTGTSATTWILLLLTAVGVYFAWRQLHKKKAAA